MQSYLDCESEDEFYAFLQQFRGDALFDSHKNTIRQFFNKPITGQFDLVCNEFKNFSLKLVQRGFFNSLNELRLLVKYYTELMTLIHDHYKDFTDIQREKIALLINIFSISSNSSIIENADMGDVIIPAYHPVMLEKIDAQQLFLRRGFSEILQNLTSNSFDFVALEAKYNSLLQLSSITQATDVIRRKANDYLICKNIWEYFGVYYGLSSGNSLLSSNAVGLSIVTDEEDDSSMLRSTPMSKIIVRNVIDYVRTFPARVDGLNIAFIAPSSMQHIVAAIHSIAKSLDSDEIPATINVKIISINSKKNSAAYLRRWLDSYFSDDRAVKVNTYLHHSNVRTKSDVEELYKLLENYDLCFTYDMLQSTRVEFDLTTDHTVDMNYEKFPMTFTPDTIPASHGKARRVNISQDQFYAAKQHSQASYIAGNPHSVPGTYRVFRRLELPEIQEAIIDAAHVSCKWVVCIDQAIDRNMLESNNSKIIGFTTGEGSYGELNVTVSARKDILKDIKQMLKGRITEKFANWDSSRLQKAADFCVDELSKYMDGSRILKALNPYDYEIHSFLAYILTMQMLGLTKPSDEYIVRALISLDSYKHWFDENDDYNDDNKRPDFLLLEIPYCKENLEKGKKLKIQAKVIECKMGYKNGAQLAHAKLQLEKGLKTLAMNWKADANGVMHRYWLNQLYRAIIFSPLNMDNTSEEYDTVRDKIYSILSGDFELSWTGDIFAFWLDVNSDQLDEYPISSSVQDELTSEGLSVGELKCHSCGQMYIQKMLLPEEERNSSFSYNTIIPPEEMEEDEPEVEEPINKDPVNVDPINEPSKLPKSKEIYIPFLHYLNNNDESSRQQSLKWFKDYYSFSNSQLQEKYENGHLKWETALDFVITDFRKGGLLENSEVGKFHITDTGKKVIDLIQEGADGSDIFELAKKAWIIKPSPEELEPENNKPDDPVIQTETEADNEIKDNHSELETIRVLIGNDKRNLPVFWEFGNKNLANRHILITGTSGQGKTYAIQAMLMELAKQNISSVVFDYTDGFLPGKLEPEFEQELEGKITQEVAIIGNHIPVNPFRLQKIEIPPFGSVPETSTTVAGRISDILRHVYSFGDQQAASIYAACKQGVDQYKEDMDFRKLRELLEESGTTQAKSVLSKMAQFFDMDLFDTTREFNWEDIILGQGTVTVIQLTGLDRQMQTIVTEIMLWDAWYSLTKFGNKNTPFVVVLDEAQNLSFKEKSPAEKILREGRKYGWSAWFATQFLKGALDSSEISNLQQASERLYFKPTGEEMSYTADQVAESKSEVSEWQNIIKGMQKGQCIVQGGRIKENGKFDTGRPVLVNVSSFSERL